MRRLLPGIGALWLVLTACGLGTGGLGPVHRHRVLSKFAPRPSSVAPAREAHDDDRMARLGQYLFWYDGFTVLDAEDAGSVRPIGCVDCHDPARGFVDGNTVSAGALLAIATRRNAPSLYHATERDFLFWDGRADSAWSQALAPLEDPLEIASNRTRVAHVVHDDPALHEAYEAVFGPLPDFSDRGRFPSDALPFPDSPDDPRLGAATRDKLSRWRAAWAQMTTDDRGRVDRVFADVGTAIAAFERRLRLSPAPFDRFLDALARRDEPAMDAALDENAQRGLKLFIEVEGGCVKCHDGPDLTDEQFHDLVLAGHGEHEPMRAQGARRLLANPFNCAGPFGERCPPDGDARLERAREDARRRWSAGRVRTPSLRNVSMTGPYMHAGQHTSLGEVLDFYDELPSARDSKPARRPRARRNRLVDVLRFDVLTSAHYDADELARVEAFLHSLASAPACPGVLERPADPRGELRCPP